jgi:3-oxoacyl-[acyl-carrier-protein] synthase-1
MVAPSGEGAVRCMKMSMQNLRNSKVDYVNTHGTSTPVGDTKEIEAMKEVFKDKVPPFSSTKSITGHSLGATSVQEAIYCLLMMKNKFIAASANVRDLDEKIKGLPIVTEVKKNIDLNCVMSNSFGFGGTNATLVFESL